MSQSWVITYLTNQCGTWHPGSFKNVDVLFNNTDSLTYQIQKDNVYEDFYAIKHLFDFLGTRKKAHSTMMKTKSNW